MLLPQRGQLELFFIKLLLQSLSSRLIRHLSLRILLQFGDLAFKEVHLVVEIKILSLDFLNGLCWLTFNLLEKTFGLLNCILVGIYLLLFVL